MWLLLAVGYSLLLTSIRAEIPRPGLRAALRVPLPHDFAVYAGLGYQFFEDPDAFEQLAWTAGISYSWKSLTLDVRYWGTDLSDEGCVVSQRLP